MTMPFLKKKTKKDEDKKTKAKVSKTEEIKDAVAGVDTEVKAPKKEAKPTTALAVLEVVYKSKKKEFKTVHMVYSGKVPRLMDIKGVEESTLSDLKNNEETANVEKVTLINIIPYIM